MKNSLTGIGALTALLTIVMTLPACPCRAGQTQQTEQVTPAVADAYPGVVTTRLSPRLLQLKVRAPGFFSTNIVVVATQKGLVVLDTWHGPFIFEQVTEIVQQQFGRRDFAYVINSHEDVDHAMGGDLFQDIIMVGHENLFKALKATHRGRRGWQTNYRGRIQGYIKGEEEKLARLDPASKEAKELMPGLENLRKLDQDFERGFPIIPDDPKALISFKDSVKLELGDVTIECYACRAGHTRSDILIYVPQEGFLFTGDAAQTYIWKNGNTQQWLELLEYFLKPGVNVKMVLTGHDERPATQEDLGRLRDYLATTWESVRKARGQGLSLEQIQNQYSLDNELSRFRSLVGAPFNVGTLELFKDRHKSNIETTFNANR
jgi:glyoxylase-like metal-dependent hydrolase (beta-lactamase superfamily II)